MFVLVSCSSTILIPIKHNIISFLKKNFFYGRECLSQVIMKIVRLCSKNHRTASMYITTYICTSGIGCVSFGFVWPTPAGAVETAIRQ